MRPCSKAIGRYYQRLSTAMMLCAREHFLYWLIAYGSAILLALDCYTLAAADGYHVYTLIAATAQDQRLISKPTPNVCHKMLKLGTGHIPDGCETLVKSVGGS